MINRVTGKPSLTATVPQAVSHLGCNCCNDWFHYCKYKLFVCIYIYVYVCASVNSVMYIYIYEPGPRTPTPPPLPPQWYPPPTPNPPTPPNLVFACYLHIYIHIYTYILPFPPLQPRTSTLFAALESHDLVNGPCLPVYFYHNLFFEPPIVCLAHGLQHICYLWITQSLPMQT